MKKPTTLIPGRYYRLTKNVNAIPAGTYRFIDEDGICLIFEVGRNIQFIITNDVLDLIEYSPPTFAALNRTTATEFRELYYNLLELEKTKLFNIGGPMTVCMMAEEPSLH